MEKRKVQNLVIGFGKAGKTLAGALAKHGQDVILVEQSKEMYGGTCINVGCIPSKTLLVEGQKGARLDDKVQVFDTAMKKRNTLIPALRQANYNKVASLEHATVIDGKATFTGVRTVTVTTAEGEVEIEGERVFINTGSQPVKLNIPGADGKHIYDSEGILSLPFHPKRMVIVGGGYISLEFACMYQAFGTEVTILEAGDTFLRREDRDVADEMMKVLTEQGIKIVLNAKTESFDEVEDHTVVNTSQGVFDADAVLVAIGRRPNTEGLGLDKTGVSLTERGYIKVDDHLRAGDNIWAVGDVAGSPQFTYGSLDDYRIVVDQLFGKGERTTENRGYIPTCVFTNPPLAQIGITEEQAKAQGLDVTVKKMPTAAIPKSKVMSEPEGLLKAIVDNKTDLILGATLFCAEAQELINLLKMAMDNHIPASYLKNQIFTHPTIAEGLNDLFA